MLSFNHSHFIIRGATHLCHRTPDNWAQLTLRLNPFNHLLHKQGKLYCKTNNTDKKK